VQSKDDCPLNVAMNRTYVIGDIHGCQGTLRALLAAIDPEPGRDTLVFLGDYIDRGPHSCGVVSDVLELRSRFPRMITLMGNHEQMLLDYPNGADAQLYLNAGGEETLLSYGAAPPYTDPKKADIPAEHVRFLNGLLSYWEDENYIYVHAGWQPGMHPAMQSRHWLLWARKGFIDLKTNFGKKVIYGHTPFKDVRVEKNKIGIDTGAVYGGGLTCLILPEERIVTVPVCDEILMAS